MAKLIIKNKYGTIPCELLNREDISLKAKGMYAFLQSKPDNWNFSEYRIAKQLKEGRDSVNNIIKELETSGYLKRIPSRDKKTGKWSGYDYVLFDRPTIQDNRSPENPLYGKSVIRETRYTDFQGTNSNIDNSNIYNSNIDIEDQPPLNENQNSSLKDKPTPSEIAREFFENPEFRNQFIKRLIDSGEYGDEREVVSEVSRFFDYWTERNKSGTKQRWELEKTFEIGKRLKTWFNNAKNWQKRDNNEVEFII